MWHHRCDSFEVPAYSHGTQRRKPVLFWSYVVIIYQFWSYNRSKETIWLLQIWAPGGSRNTQTGKQKNGQGIWRYIYVRWQRISEVAFMEWYEASVSHFCIFGCTAYAHTSKVERHKRKESVCYWVKVLPRRVTVYDLNVWWFTAGMLFLMKILCLQFRKTTVKYVKLEIDEKPNVGYYNT